MIDVPLRMVRVANTPRPWMGEERTEYMRGRFVLAVMAQSRVVENTAIGHPVGSERGQAVAATRANSSGVVTAGSAVDITRLVATRPPRLLNWRDMR